MTTIYREELTPQQTVQFTGRVFGLNFPFRLEPTICQFARRLSADYSGGDWAFFGLSNGGFYMAPRSDGRLRVAAANGFDGAMSADAFGITSCLYALSHLSFARYEAFSEAYSEQFHLLRAHSLDHPEAGAIVAAID
ncbi:antirestriction protein [Rhizobacter fulvus]